VPLQNRVAPTGEIHADPGRGTLTGNRGCLHGTGRALGPSRWRPKLWISCTLDWRGWRRDPMPPGRWTMLFFLDEATALAAGHRPAYRSYVDAWQAATGADRPHAHEMDAVLHAERVDRRTRRQVTRPAVAGDLPDGVMVRLDGEEGLLSDGRFRRWSFIGYGRPRDLPPTTPVTLLTPPSSVAALRAGYRAGIHPSALA
jgi:hypothetical protein